MQYGTVQQGFVVSALVSLLFLSGCTNLRTSNSTNKVQKLPVKEFIISTHGEDEERFKCSVHAASKSLLNCREVKDKE